MAMSLSCLLSQFVKFLGRGRNGGGALAGSLPPVYSGSLLARNPVTDGMRVMGIFTSSSSMKRARGSFFVQSRESHQLVRVGTVQAAFAYHNAQIFLLLNLYIHGRFARLGNAIDTYFSPLRLRINLQLFGADTGRQTHPQCTQNHPSLHDLNLPYQTLIGNQIL